MHKSISKRLLKCAEMISHGTKVVDVGTDHAYLPIYLCLNKKISHAIASDLREGPLKNAKSNIKSFNLENMIETRISDGLKNIEETEIDEVIIAGMGGNIIVNILEECTWKNKIGKRFILQPMKYESNLRKYLSKNGYEIEKESAVMCMGKIYTVIKALYTNIPYSLSPYEYYIGNLVNSLDTDAKLYIGKQINDLKNRQKGAIIQNNKEKETYYTDIIEKLRNILSI